MSQPRLIFDRPLLRERHLRAQALGPSTFLIDRVAQDLADRLAAVVRRFECAVDLGTPTDALCRQLARSGKIDILVAAGIGHPAAQHWRNIEPVAIFERMHESACDLIIAHCCTGAPIGRRISDCLHGKKPGRGLVGERNAEPFTIGWGDKRKLGPAGRAKAGPLDGLAAYGAKLR